MRGVRKRCVRKLDRFLRTTLCPVCNKHRFGVDEDFYICPICGWENDGLQNDNPDYAANSFCLTNLPYGQLSATEQYSLHFLSCQRSLELHSFGK